MVTEAVPCVTVCYVDSAFWHNTLSVTAHRRASFIAKINIRSYGCLEVAVGKQKFNLFGTSVSGACKVVVICDYISFKIMSDLTGESTFHARDSSFHRATLSTTRKPSYCFTSHGK